MPASSQALEDVSNSIRSMCISGLQRRNADLENAVFRLERKLAAQAEATCELREQKAEQQRRRAVVEEELRQAVRGMDLRVRSRPGPNRVDEHVSISMNGDRFVFIGPAYSAV